MIRRIALVSWVRSDQIIGSPYWIEIDRNFLFHGGSIWRRILCVNRILTTKYGIRCRSLCEGFVESAVLLINRLTFLLNYPPWRPFFGGVQADLSSMSQISFADSSNSQSVIPEYIRPRTRYKWSALISDWKYAVLSKSQDALLQEGVFAENTYNVTPDCITENQWMLFVTMNIS